MTSGQMTIRKLSGVYFSAAGMDAGFRVQDRLDSIARKTVGGYIETMCRDLINRHDKEIVLIRRLGINCCINLAWDNDRIARAWAKEITIALDEECTGAGNENVLVFKDQAAYLAQFIEDLAAGDAWSKWYYRRFEGLKSLPSSAAIRSALSADPAIGVDALQRLSVTACKHVLEALNPEDARRVMGSFASLPDALTSDACLPRVLESSRMRSQFPIHDPRWALAVYVNAGRDRGGGSALLSVIAACAIRKMCATTDIGATSAANIPGWMAELGGLQALPAISDMVFASEDTDSVAAEEPHCTPFGGGFLLLPLLANLPIDRIVAGWPELAGSPAARVIRALVLSRALGGNRSDQFLADSLWSEILGLSGKTDWSSVHKELSGLGSTALSALQQMLAGQAADLGSAATVSRQIASMNRTWRIDQDEEGYWHGVTEIRPKEPATAIDDDLRYLATSPAQSLDPAWEMVLCHAAQLILRQFARRLPGFGLSHFDYLFRNFLDVTARVEQESGRYTVHLSRPPLALMLNLTGMTRAEYALPWRTGSTCALYDETT